MKISQNDLMKMSFQTANNFQNYLNLNYLMKLRSIEEQNNFEESYYNIDQFSFYEEMTREIFNPYNEENIKHLYNNNLLGIDMNIDIR